MTPLRWLGAIPIFASKLSGKLQVPSNTDEGWLAALTGIPESLLLLLGLTCLLLGYWFLVTAIPRGRRNASRLPDAGGQRGCGWSPLGPVAGAADSSVKTPHPAIRQPAHSGEIGDTPESQFSTRRNPTCLRCGIAAPWPMRIFTTRTYERAVRKLLSEGDREVMEAAIVADPGAAPVVQGTGGLRKLRWPGSGRDRLCEGGSGRPEVSGQKGAVAACGRDQERGTKPMTIQRTDLGRELEEALGEVLAHVRGTTPLPCRIVDDPAAEHIVALRKRMKLSRQKFADSFGLDVRALQEWEQGRRVPDRAARVLLTVIDREPEAVLRALGK